MAKLAITGAVGEMKLLEQHDVETGRLCRSVSVQASDDGKSVLLIEVDERKVGIQREYRFEVTTGELIALIRAHGAYEPEICQAEIGHEGMVAGATSDGRSSASRRLEIADEDRSAP